MRFRSGSFYADWRDENGIRCMKAFSTQRAARLYQDKMHAEAKRKKARAQGAGK